jgi:hypothetical protein
VGVINCTRAASELGPLIPGQRTRRDYFSMSVSRHDRTHAPQQTRRLSGGDAYIAYAGGYRLDGKNFEAVINTKRHTEGPPTWFGIDEVVIRVSGKSTGRIAAGVGTVDQCPGLPLDVTLMWIEDEHPKRHIDYSKVELRPDRLPSPGR